MYQLFKHNFDPGLFRLIEDNKDGTAQFVEVNSGVFFSEFVQWENPETITYKWVEMYKNL